MLFVFCNWYSFNETGLVLLLIETLNRGIISNPVNIIIVINIAIKINFEFLFMGIWFEHTKPLNEATKIAGTVNSSNSVFIKDIIIKNAHNGKDNKAYFNAVLPHLSSLNKIPNKKGTTPETINVTGSLINGKERLTKMVMSIPEPSRSKTFFIR
jgi:hypothetical protein